MRSYLDAPNPSRASTSSTQTRDVVVPLTQSEATHKLASCILRILATAYGSPEDDQEAQNLLIAGVEFMLKGYSAAKTEKDKLLLKDLWNAVNGQQISRDILRAFVGRQNYRFSVTNADLKMAKASVKAKRASKSEANRNYRDVTSKVSSQTAKTGVIRAAVEAFLKKPTTVINNLAAQAAGWRSETTARNHAFIDSKVTCYDELQDFLKANLEYDGSAESKTLLFLALQSSSNSALRVLGFRTEESSDGPLDLGGLKDLLSKKGPSLDTELADEQSSAETEDGTADDEDDSNADETNEDSDDAEVGAPEERSSNKGTGGRTPISKLGESSSRIRTTGA